MKKFFILIALITLVFAVGTVQAKDWKMVRIGVEGRGNGDGWGVFFNLGWRF